MSSLYQIAQKTQRRTPNVRAHCVAKPECNAGNLEDKTQTQRKEKTPGGRYFRQLQ